MSTPGSRRAFIAAALLSLLLTACSAGFRTQIARAERLEQEKHFDSALAIYDTMLPLMSGADHHLLAQVELHRGICLWSMARTADAFAAYSKAFEYDPANLAVRLKLAEIYLAGNAPENAIEHAQVVLKSDPDNGDAHAVLGGSYAALGRAADAITELKTAERLNPGNMQNAIALADLYNALDQEEGARQVLRAAAQANPTHADAWLALGRLEEQEGDNRAAEAAYRAAVKSENTAQTNFRLAQFLQRTAQTSEAEQILRRVDSFQPQQPTALADFEFMSGHANRAEQHYAGVLRPIVHTKATVIGRSTHIDERASERAGIVARLIESEIAAASEQRGFASSGMNPLLQRASSHLEEYRAELDPASIAVLEAEIALAQGDIPMSVLRAQSALSLSPDSAAAHFVLGQARLRGGERALARSEWQMALGADDAYAPARVALAELSLEQGSAQDANEYIVPVVRQEPGNLQALVTYARALIVLGNFDGAESLAHRAAAVDSNSPLPHMALGEVALRQHHLGNALIEFEQAVLLAPHAPDAIDGLTRVYRFGKVTRPMLQRMEAAASTPPQSSTLMEITGRLYADRGWNADAERCLRMALAADPNRTTAAAALGRVLAARGDFERAAEAASAPHPESAALVAGVRAQDSGDFHAAVREYEFAVRHGEHSGVAANNLAWIYARQGTRLDRALSLAYNAHDMQPDNPAVLDTLGMVHLARREYTQGVDALERAHRLLGRMSPDDPKRSTLQAQIQQHLSEAYLRAGQSDAAAKIANP